MVDIRNSYIYYVPHRANTSMIYEKQLVNMGYNNIFYIFYLKDIKKRHY